MGIRGLKKYRPWIITALIYWGVSAVVLLSSYHGLSQEADGTNCASGVVGLCTPGTFESSTETVTETTQTDATGTTTTTTTTSTTPPPITNLTQSILNGPVQVPNNDDCWNRCFGRGGDCEWCR